MIDDMNISDLTEDDFMRDEYALNDVCNIKKNPYASKISIEEKFKMFVNAFIAENHWSKEYAKKENASIVPICAKVEADLLEIEDEDEKEMFMEELGLEETGLNLLIKTTYEKLGLKTFLTCGHDECRAWTFKNGMKAPECAGIIHTDFEKGFIKAEVYSYSDLVKYGSEQACKENGKYRIEGKDYIMQDGDIVFFKFNR